MRSLIMHGLGLATRFRQEVSLLVKESKGEYVDFWPIFVGCMEAQGDRVLGPHEVLLR